MLEILSHVNKRVKDMPAIGLPLTELLAMFVDPTQAPLVSQGWGVGCALPPV